MGDSNYGRNRAFNKRAVEHNEPGLDELTDVIGRHLIDLGPGETPLSRVVVSRKPNGQTEYHVRDANGIVIAILNETDLANPTADALRRAVRQVQCSDCGTELLEGEHGLCGPCEGKAIKDLLAMQAEFDT